MQEPIHKKEKNRNIYKLITMTQTNPIKLSALLNVEMFQKSYNQFFIYFVFPTLKQ
jgi:hypothetical protein